MADTVGSLMIYIHISYGIGHSSFAAKEWKESVEI